MRLQDIKVTETYPTYDLNIWAKKPEARARLVECVACPEYISDLDICSKGNYLASIRVRLGIAECPIGKWSSTDDKQIDEYYL